MRGCLENPVGCFVYVGLLIGIVVPAIVAAALPALPLVLVLGVLWLLVRILRSEGMHDYMERATARSVAAGSRPTQAVRTPPPTSPIPPRLPAAGVLPHASGRPFRVVPAPGAGSRRGHHPLWAEAYDDGRVRGYALYGGATGGVTVLPAAEFQVRYRAWQP